MKLARLVWIPLAAALVTGLAIGTCARRRAERPTIVIVEAARQPRSRPTHATSATPARAFASRASVNSRSDSRFT